VEKLTQALKLVETRLADPKLYDRAPAEAADWQKKHADVTQKLADAEDAWLDAQGALEGKVAAEE
jgi:ATP-binding cassette subfamily F protein 3